MHISVYHRKSSVCAIYTKSSFHLYKMRSAEHASVAVSLTLGGIQGPTDPGTQGFRDPGNQGPRDPKTHGKSLGPWVPGTLGLWLLESRNPRIRDSRTQGPHGPRNPGTRGRRDPRTHVGQGFGSLGPWVRGSLASSVLRHSLEYNITRLMEHGRHGISRPGFCVFCVLS